MQNDEHLCSHNEETLQVIKYEGNVYVRGRGGKLLKILKKYITTKVNCLM
jgi:hypothetical protein